MWEHMFVKTHASILKGPCRARSQTYTYFWIIMARLGRHKSNMKSMHARRLEPECKTPWTMHYHHESIRWNLYMLLRTRVWVSSTNDPCSLVMPLTTWQHGHVLFSTGPYAMREGRVLYLIVTALGRPGTAKCFRRETPKSQAWIIQLNNHLHAHKSQSSNIYNTCCSLGGRLLQKWCVLQHNRPPVSRKCCK